MKRNLRRIWVINDGNVRGEWGTHTWQFSSESEEDIDGGRRAHGITYCGGDHGHGVLQQGGHGHGGVGGGCSGHGGGSGGGSGGGGGGDVQGATAHDQVSHGEQPSDVVAHQYGVYKGPPTSVNSVGADQIVQFSGGKGSKGGKRTCTSDGRPLRKVVLDVGGPWEENDVDDAGMVYDWKNKKWPTGTWTHWDKDVRTRPTYTDSVRPAA